MNLFELAIKIGVDDSDFNRGIGKAKRGFGDFSAWTIAKGQLIADAIKSSGKAFLDLGKQAINSYAEYEQLVGGVDTLFKNASQKVQEYAANAYKTAGISANEYMSTVTSFSASLLQSLGGDTQAAADYANQALIDMSDNANKMGTDMSLIQNAYQGFAKANYTMLDNLKLGYGGTQTEMQRLISDAAKLSDTVDAQSMSFANIVEAIHVVQDNMGIAGATALEAGTTIEGSVNSMKAAWSNLITGLADENANISELVNNLVTSIVGDGTEENLGVLGNIMPAIKTALSGASTLIGELLPEIVAQIPAIITENLPILAEAAISIVQSLVDGISQNQEMLMTTAMETITYLATSLISMLPEIIALGLELVVSLATGISDSLPKLIPAIIDVILQIVETLTSPKQLGEILDAALTLITELAYGLMDAIPQLVDACIEIILNLVEFLTSPENIGKLLVAAVELVLALATGLINAIPKLLTSTGKLIKSLIDNFKETDWGQVGKDIVNGIWNGLKKMWGSLKKWFSDAWDSLVGGVKDLLGIHSPSRVFAEIGKNMALGVGEGWGDEFGTIKSDIDKSMTFDDASIRVKSAVDGFGMNGASGAHAFGGVSIVQNIYSEAKTAADLMQEALYQQERAVFIGA